VRNFAIVRNVNSQLKFDISNSDFENYISNEDTSLVFFKDNMCETCEKVFDVLNEIKDIVPIYIVDVMADMELARKYSIRRVPTVIIFKGGRIEVVLVGVTYKKDLLLALGK